ncbi:hypothetical protein Q7N08_02675 [Candidatus Liberibacter asiaticus]
MKSGMNARLVSSHLLSCVMRKRISLTCLLDLEYGDSAFRLLSQRDQILVRAIVNVTLRFLPRIDAVLDFVLISSFPVKIFFTAIITCFCCSNSLFRCCGLCCCGFSGRTSKTR